MYGSWIFNLVLSITSFILYAVLSLPNRPVTNALIESVIAAVIFYFFAYLLRYLFGYFMKEAEIKNVDNEIPSSGDSVQKNEASANEILNELNDDDIKKLSGHIKDLID